MATVHETLVRYHPTNNAELIPSNVCRVQSIRTTLRLAILTSDGASSVTPRQRAFRIFALCMYYTHGAIIRTPNVAWAYELRACRLGESTYLILGTIERSNIHH